MEKINFKDLPSTETPINSDNLNEMQDNIEKAYEPSFAQMHTNTRIELTSTNTTEYDVWGDSVRDISEGEFYCDATNKRIVIPPNSAKTIEISGKIAGDGAINCYIELWDKSNLIKGTNLYTRDINYKCIPIGNTFIKIPDTSKEYYVKCFMANVQDSEFYLNDGFGVYATYMNVKKLK